MIDLKKAKAGIVAGHYAYFPEESTGPTGPKTEAGKQRIRLNAYKHGLTGQIHLFTQEDHEAFEKHCRSIVDDLAPVGALEQQLAQSIAEAYWRLNRACALESGIYALGQMREFDEPVPQALTQAKTWLADGKNLQLLCLYQQRIQRSIEKHMADLRTLRAERLAARQQAVDEAVLLSELAKSKGETYDAAADPSSPQFVFSSPEMKALLPQWIARKQRLDEARALRKTRNNPNPNLKMPAAA